MAGRSAIYRAIVGRHKWRPYRVECGLQGLDAFMTGALVAINGDPAESNTRQKTLPHFPGCAFMRTW